MHTITWDLVNLTKRHPEGSFATQANRRDMLQLFGDQLWEAGYKQLRARDLKGRHITALLQRWQADELSPGTLKNRLAVLRWWARKVGKAAVLAKSNDHYGVPKRVYVPTDSKAQALPADKLALVRNAYVRMSLELQHAFGLRREEAIKIKPWQADQGERLALQGSWCKGGRPREVPIETPEQREVLERAKALVRFKSAALIPKGKTYVEQLHTYEAQCARAGLHKMHGLRHAYAQERYEAFTGLPSPVAGGPRRDTMTAEERERDYDARLEVSETLGHSRIGITSTYIGSNRR